MLFSSITFLFYFLPVFFLFYYGFRARNTTLLVFSILFYAWGELRYVPLLAAYIVVNWAFGLCIERAVSSWRGRVLAAGVTVNLLLLLFYKYFDFLAEQVNAVRSLLGMPQLDLPTIPIALGVSFFTFQGISYLVDVYRRHVAAQSSLLKFATYKAMFPPLLAGPIVRYREVADRIDSRTVIFSRVRHGICRFALGLTQKVLIADTVAECADAVFSLNSAALTPAVAWVGVMTYTVQIYFDFAGYSNMAIGLGQMLGFRFPENFDRPYISESVTEFWRRWHMTLSAWFRDYVYVPLGGNRQGSWRTFRNLILVFFLCGLWHGASWTFVVWGAYQGFFLVLERAGLHLFLRRLWKPLRHAYLLLVVMIGWVFFRSETLSGALEYIAVLFGNSTADPIMVPVAKFLTSSVLTASLAGLCLAVLPPLSERDTTRWLARTLQSTKLCAMRNIVRLITDAGCVLLLFLAVAILATSTYRPFIYFRF